MGQIADWNIRARVKNLENISIKNTKLKPEKVKHDIITFEVGVHEGKRIIIATGRDGNLTVKKPTKKEALKRIKAVLNENRYTRMWDTWYHHE